MLTEDDSDITGHQGTCRKYSGNSDPESGQRVLPDVAFPDSRGEPLSVQRGSSFDQVPGKVSGFIGGLHRWHGQTMAVPCPRCNCNVWNPQQHERWHRYADS